MVVSSDSNGVLVTLIHVPRTTDIRGRENNAPSDGVEVEVRVVVGCNILKSTVEVGAQARLIV